LFYLSSRGKTLTLPLFFLLPKAAAARRVTRLVGGITRFFSRDYGKPPAVLAVSRTLHLLPPFLRPDSPLTYIPFQDLGFGRGRRISSAVLWAPVVSLGSITPFPFSVFCPVEPSRSLPCVSLLSPELCPFLQWRRNSRLVTVMAISSFYFPSVFFVSFLPL